MKTTLESVLDATSYRRGTHEQIHYIQEVAASRFGLDLSPALCQEIWLRWSASHFQVWSPLPAEPTLCLSLIENAIDQFFEPWNVLHGIKTWKRN